MSEDFQAFFSCSSKWHEKNKIVSAFETLLCYEKCTDFNTSYNSNVVDSTLSVQYIEKV